MESYQTFVAAQRQRNPSIDNVMKFLTGEWRNTSPCRLVILEFSSHAATPLVRDIEVEQLESLLKPPGEDTKSDICGRILIIEDLTKSIIETLGSVLRLDPVFFASHLHSPWPDISTQTSDMAILPSRLRLDTYVNIHYHRTIVFDDPKILLKQLLRSSNVHRKVVILPKTKGVRIGLAQHSCSIYKTLLSDNTWICLTLVDPEMSSTYYSVKERKKEVLHFNVKSGLFLNGYEDFLHSGTPPTHNEMPGPSRAGLMADLIYYWKRHQPQDFHSNSPTVLQLAYYPLRIVAAEWVNYLTVMHHSIKEYEYSIGDLPDLLRELGRLNSDLQSLQSWRRRSMSSEQKLKSVSRFIRWSPGQIDQSSFWELLAQDYDHLAASVADFGQRFERMLPIVTSMVQIADSRQSFAETANVSRLTYLALVFVPLTFTTGLFSMNNDIAPGSSGFWMFFIVAIPMTLIVFAAARPPVSEVRMVKDYFKRMHIPELPVFRADSGIGSADLETETPIPTRLEVRYTGTLSRDLR